MTVDQKNLRSHVIETVPINDCVLKIQERIKENGDKPYVTVARQLQLLQQLKEFDFGRFSLQNQGVNGYWTHYMLMHPKFGRKTGKNNHGELLTDLEKFLLDKAPTVLATQQRFEIFLQENQKAIKNNAKLACIPSGMMGELLYLDYKNINNIQLIGIDYDAETLKDAEALAKKQQLSEFVSLLKKDAWQLNFSNEFDLISSNGLNIYEADDKKVIDLYQQFYAALKPGGKLVTSFLTFPPTLTEQCEWDMSKINQEDLLLQKIIFSDIINVKCQCFRSTEQTKFQLETAGYVNIKFLYDDAKIFPTVIANKQ